ncbi:hypothetical protein PILCRDRAFT_810149 [Piloderma croceum F 1598]|uniref:Uncharacterized protein n=1 Tax=Piloderma croceum (strain F 1598) TaxID=765440 RepID=A0A0C3G7F5_PILCF|nr:hypothetical protein PILCRDRAFT_810149 [Piloderma croceum F 1598]
MSSIPAFDDTTQSVIYIPYQGLQKNDSDGVEYDLSPSESYRPFQERDIPNGYELRMKVYRAAWTKCLDRVQAIIRDLHEPVVDAVIRHVHNAYKDILPGLPYCEMPVISVTAGPSLLHEITTRLDPDNDGSEDSSMEASPPSSSHPDTFVTHLFPADRPNIMACMKSLVGGFVDRSPDGLEQPKRKPSTSLAPYDIELLEAWYDAVRRAHEPGTPPQLVVLLHDFEQFDPVVIQDLFYICSLHVPSLPLIFILSLSSPPTPSPSYLHLTYPRATLALLRVENFAVPSGPGVLDDILTKTMFDVGFEQDIVIGPTVIDSLSDFFTRHNSSLDALITILHLAHLKHFDDPLTVFVHDDGNLSSLLLQPTSFPFLDHLLTRISAPPASSSVAPSPTHSTAWLNQSVPFLLASIDEARTGFRTKMRKTKVALGLMKRVKEFMLRQGWRSADERSQVELMFEALKGRLGRDGRYLGTMVKKLPAAKLRSVLEDMHTFFQNMPSHVRRDEEPARTKIVAWISELASESESSRSGFVVQLAGMVGGWLTNYFQDNLTSLEECRLWDIWYTGNTPFPSEMINPNIRASIVSGLLHPLDYVNLDDVRQQQPELWELPDTSILFKRYLDSGKMINVYDWFESFAVVLESQKRHRKRSKLNGNNSKTISRKGKGKQRQVDDVMDEDEGENEEDEKWKMEVQARFMRSLHELDYLGFIKHTGRKADHVLRTVFDIAD